MFHFFRSVLQAGTNMTEALARGPSATIEEMQAAQKTRAQTFIDLMRSVTYTPQQLSARKQYWYAQIFFLLQLMRKHQTEFAQICGTALTLEDEGNFASTLRNLLAAIEDKQNLNRFIDLLDRDEELIEEEVSSGQISEHVPPEINLFKGDVIELMKKLGQQGHFMVIDNAPNSHRDGAAKYSRGSVEELLSRFMDSAFKMPLRFTDVHERNKDFGQYAFAKEHAPVDIGDYQKRYLQMLLTICIKVLEQDVAYLNSADFLNDLFTSYPNETDDTHLPIYYDLQNNVYELAPTSTLVSNHWFADTQNFNTCHDIFSAPSTAAPVKVVSYAAPDLRRFETAPMDVRATSNTILQKPQAEGLLACSLAAGIKSQCEAAISLAKNYKTWGIDKPISVIFIMPGCGAFQNPQQSTAANFISTIKYFVPQLVEHGIACHIAEFNPTLQTLFERNMEKYGSELGELNVLINQIKDADLRKKAITVREHLVNLLEDQNDMNQNLMKYLLLTIQLLKAPPGEERKRLAEEYQQQAMSIEQLSINPLWEALGVAMFALGAGIAAAAIVLTTGALTLGLVGAGALISWQGSRWFSHNKSNNLLGETEELIDEVNAELSV